MSSSLYLLFSFRFFLSFGDGWDRAVGGGGRQVETVGLAINGGTPLGQDVKAQVIAVSMVVNVEDWEGVISSLDGVTEVWCLQGDVLASSWHQLI